MPQPVDQKILTALVRHGGISADEVAMQHYLTGADRTRAIVKRTLEALLANGLIRAVPQDEWPEYVVPFPPYTRITQDDAITGGADAPAIMSAEQAQAARQMVALEADRALRRAGYPLEVTAMVHRNFRVTYRHPGGLEADFPVMPDA